MSTPHGPNNAPTPDDYADIHDSTNPYSSGEKIQNVSDVAPNAYPIVAGGVPGYFVNPPAADPANANNDGAGEFSAGERGAAAEVASGLDALYQDALGPRNATGGSDEQPSAGDVYFDEGYGQSGSGRS